MHLTEGGEVARTGRVLEQSAREDCQLRPCDCQFSAAMMAMGSLVGTGRTSVPAHLFGFRFRATSARRASTPGNSCASTWP